MVFKLSSPLSILAVVICLIRALLDVHYLSPDKRAKVVE